MDKTKNPVLVSNLLRVNKDKLMLSSSDHTLLLREPKETRKRSIVKVGGWRLSGSAISASLAALSTYELAHHHIQISKTDIEVFGGIFFTIDICIKAGAQYVYERFWTRIKWGYTNGPEKNKNV